MTSTQFSPPRLRASDADRTAIAETLQDAVARGLLTVEEGGERLAAAFAAVHRDELPPLTADLPGAAVPATASRLDRWRALLVQARTEFGVAVLLAVLVIGLVIGAVVGSAFDGGHEAFAGGHR